MYKMICKKGIELISGWVNKVSGVVKDDRLRRCI